MSKTCAQVNNCFVRIKKKPIVCFTINDLNVIFGLLGIFESINVTSTLKLGSVAASEHIIHSLHDIAKYLTFCQLKHFLYDLLIHKEVNQYLFTHIRPEFCSNSCALQKSVGIRTVLFYSCLCLLFTYVFLNQKKFQSCS